MYVYRLAFTTPLVLLLFRSLALFLARESPSLSLSLTPSPLPAPVVGLGTQRRCVISKLTDSLCVSLA